MSQLQNLLELVQSLDKSEKRYFRLHHSGTGKKESQLLDLFDKLQEEGDAGSGSAEIT